MADSPALALVPALSDEAVHNAVRNEHHKPFEFGGRAFELKDLTYDDYVQFLKLAAPIVESVVSVIQPVLKANPDGTTSSDIEFSMGNLDMSTIADLAGHNLPILAHLVLKQSDQKVTLADTKALSMSRLNPARGPLAMVELVLKQVAHNKMIEEFAQAFPRLGSLVAELAPNLATLTAPTAAPTSPTATTPS